MTIKFGLVVSLCAMDASSVSAKDYLVSSQGEYFAAAEKVEAGDTVILADGNWADFEIVFSGNGTSEKPITLTSQNPGMAIITGQSSLRIGGEYIIVKGLVFKDGFSPTGETISFRTSKSDLANNSRISEVVVDGFSKPDRYESDYWVGMYGKNNRFDHNFLAGKTNKGVTFAVRLDSEESRENGHRVDHNYFGYRPVLGSNGGETLRVGTSHYSMFNSNTVIEDNYFENTDGEVEIISIKSGKNVVRGNVFDASQGAVTLRHGDGNIVERNIFLGRGKDHTGGVRVINADQTVSNNYMEGLRGSGFSSALTIMNGVPNSPVNRYVQVSNSRINNNTVIDSARITLGAGADEERSAAPVDTSFSQNLLGGMANGTFIGVDADISGIALDGNRLISGNVDPALSSIKRGAVKLERAENGLLYPADPALSDVGAPRDLDPVKREDTGPKWYAKPKGQAALGSGEAIAVAPGEGTIEAALAGAKDGDTLMLAAGNYLVNKTILVDKSLTLSGPGKGSAKAIIAFERPSLFEMFEGGNLRLENLTVSGSEAPDNVGNNIIRTSAAPIRGNFSIEMSRVSIADLTVNRNFDVIVIGKNAFADSIKIEDSAFSNITGVVVKADAETDDYGQYGVEYLTISGSSFADIGKGVANLYRGGRDESTFGPHFNMTSSALAKVGSAEAPSVILHGVQITDISSNSFADSGAVKIIHTVGTPDTVIAQNSFDKADAVEVVELNYSGESRVDLSANSMPGKLK